MTVGGSIVEPLDGTAVPIGIRAGPRTATRAAVGSSRGPVVQVEALTKRFGEVLAVDNLSFALEPGTITGSRTPRRHLTIPGSRKVE